MHSLFVILKPASGDPLPHPWEGRFYALVQPIHAFPIRVKSQLWHMWIECGEILKRISIDRIDS